MKGAECICSFNKSFDSRKIIYIYINTIGNKSYRVFFTKMLSSDKGYIILILNSL